LSETRIHEAGAGAFSSSRSIAVLDFLRWASALEVMVGHVRDMVFIDYRDVVGSGIAVKLFYFVTSFGFESVMVFFVLSGYLVGGKVVSDRRAGIFSWPPYIINRFSRIYVVLVPALMLTILCDRLGAHLFVDVPLYHGSHWSPSVYFDYRTRTSWPILACNLANLQFIACPAYGSNGPLWSLAMEWFYYLTFPILLWLVRDAEWSARYALRLGVVLLGAAVGYRYAHGTILLYPVWLMGVAARLAAERFRLGWPVAAIAFFALLYSLPAERFGSLRWSVGVYAIGASLALLISCAPLLRVTFAARLNKSLADFSYSLYAAHFPLAMFGLALLQHEGVLTRREPVSAHSLAIFGGIALAIYGTSYVLSLATERHTATVRNWLKRRFAISRARALS
jgi:peptidoglycan/LPS O-acetylase OafA/YrhL